MRRNRRPLSERVIALFLAALLFGVAGEDVFALHHCPHHGLIPGAHAATGVVADAEHAAAVHGPAHSAPSRQGDGEHDGGCTCIGACRAGGDAPPSNAPPVQVAFALAVRTLPVVVESSRRPRVGAYLLPYANGPPAGR